MSLAKSFDIPKSLVWDAYRRVKASGGSAGVDQQSLAAFEDDLKGNLYKLWNRMSSGSYFPPAVKGVPIPKKSGGTRMLGVPTVSDRVAQMVVRLIVEPKIDQIFHRDSYGYRPGKSAHDALRITRTRCWRYDWVVEFDIKGLFDNIDHELLMAAVRKHIQDKWILLFVERWLTAPILSPSGELIARAKGTPQGGVISPLLANLFLHYAFDSWVERKMPGIPFCRYADDGLLHCKSKAEATHVLSEIAKRFSECRLEIHPDKSKIVYCKDNNRKEDHDEVAFDFLGYTFQPRIAKDRHGERFVSFSPGVSNKAKKAMRQRIRDMKLQFRSDASLEDLAAKINPVTQGWFNYYCRFYKSAMYPIWHHLNRAIAKWASRKYKRLRRHKRNAVHWLGSVALRMPKLFRHWEFGLKPAAG